MNNDKSIMSRNKNGDLHGYQEHYYKNILYLRCMTKNRLAVGYYEWHDNNNIIRRTNFYIR